MRLGIARHGENAGFARAGAHRDVASCSIYRHVGDRRGHTGRSHSPPAFAEPPKATAGDVLSHPYMTRSLACSDSSARPRPTPTYWRRTASALADRPGADRRRRSRKASGLVEIKARFRRAPGQASPGRAHSFKPACACLAYRARRAQERTKTTLVVRHSQTIHVGTGSNSARQHIRDVGLRRCTDIGADDRLVRIRSPATPADCLPQRLWRYGYAGIIDRVGKVPCRVPPGSRRIRLKVILLMGRIIDALCRTVRTRGGGTRHLRAASRCAGHFGSIIVRSILRPLPRALADHSTSVPSTVLDRQRHDAPASTRQVEVSRG